MFKETINKTAKLLQLTRALCTVIIIGVKIRMDVKRLIAENN